MASSEGRHHESGGAILAAFLVNVGIAVTKFVGFLVTGFSALLAESIHSVADSCNQGLLTLGGRQAARGPTELHQFGYGRVRYFWAFVVAVVLFTLGGVFSVYEGYHKVADPHDIDSPAVAIVILVLAAAFEGFALRTAARHAKPQRGTRSWARYIRESRSPELPVLLLEGSGALLGLLIGESASPDLQRRIEAAFEGGPGVRRVIHVLTQHLGPQDLLVAAKVEFDGDLTTTELVDAINACEERVRATPGVGVARIYVEPDFGRRESVVEAAPTSE